MDINRYNRHIILSEIGMEGQQKLSKASVLVIGAGGLGCPVLQYLTAAGVGRLGVIDFDIVEVSNLQRQILFGNSSLGINKAIAAKERLLDLNDAITIEAYSEKLIHKNAKSLFNKYDIIVDGTDNFATRYLVGDASVITKKPLVYAGIYKFEGQVSVFNYQGGPSYRCLFPDSPEEGSIPNCSEIGVIGILPGIIGTIQANEVLKIILGIGEVLSGKVLCYNALTNKTTTISIQNSDSDSMRKAKNHYKKKEGLFQSLFKKSNSNSYEISIKEAFKLENSQFVDIREYHELPKIIGLNYIHIPFSEFKKSLHKINPEKENILFCQVGVRSRKAAAILRKNGVHRSFSLREGASEIQNYVKQQYH